MNLLTCDFNKKPKQYIRSLKDTVELRRELAEKQNQSRDLLLAEKPDRAKIAMVSEQIYQIIDVIQGKARVAGIEQGLGSGTAGCACRRQLYEQITGHAAVHGH